MINVCLYLMVGVLLTVHHFFGPVFNGTKAQYWWCTHDAKVKDTLTLFIFTILLWPLWAFICLVIIFSAKMAARKRAKVQLIFNKHSKPTVF